jgi:parallel beta-helix repeat protein
MKRFGPASRKGWLASATLAVLFCLTLGGGSSAAGGAPVLYVDQANPSCTDSGAGAGSQTTPFCTIGAAAAKTAAGTTVQVASGTYTEQVSPKISGASGSPVVYTAAPGATVTVTGKNYGFYLSALSYVTVNGFTVTGTVNQGIYSTNSSNLVITANHVTLSGQPQKGQTRSGIFFNNTSSSLISGNTTDHNTDAGIQLSGGSTGDEVRGNTTFSNAQVWQRQAAGIRLYKSPGNVVDRNITHDNEDSGIESFSGSNNTLLYDNVSYRNGDHGIDNYASTGQTIISNSVYKNVTAGINVEGTSPGATIYDNISVDNGIASPRTHSDIRVEKGSTTGTTVDWNLVYLSTPDTLLIWNSVSYSTLSAYQAASGQMANGIVADPKWLDAANGDFHLTAGSPAIDSANSAIAGEPATDVEGNARVDDAHTPNTGTGPRTYDDRGAYEFQPPDYAPAAALQITPSSGTAPLSVTADASASTDVDSTPIASYTFSFGDGSATVGPQKAATATHTYTTPGTYTATVTVTDTAGNASTATTSVTVAAAPPQAALSVSPASGDAPLAVTADASASSAGSNPIASYSFDFGDGTTVGPQSSATAPHTFQNPGSYTVTVTVTDTKGLSQKAGAIVTVSSGGDFPPAAALTVTPAQGQMPLQVTADASASTDSDSTPIASYTFDFGDGSKKVGPQSSPTATHSYTAAGSYTVTVTVTDTAGLTGRATRTVTVADAPPAAAVTVTPPSGAAPLAVTADASASTDTDATGIATYSFDFGDGTTAGPQSSATATHTYTTPGTYTVTATVTDTAGNAGTATTQVSVGQGLVANPGFETGTSGWNTSGSGSGVTLTQVAGGHSGSYAAALTNTSASKSGCTLNDSPDSVGSTSAGTYTASIWARSDDSGRTFSLRIREYNGGKFQGSATSTLKLSPTWQQVSVSYTPKLTGSSLDLNGFTTAANSPPGVCFYADDVALALGPQATPPTAVLAVSPTSGPAPLAVTADASGSTDTTGIQSYSFDFGDGTAKVGPQAGATATHTYQAAGTFTVTVTVTDTAGLTSTATKTVSVGSAGGTPPTAALTVSPASGPSPLAVTADASGSTDSTGIQSYTFDFGDGSAAVGPQAGATATHTYQAAGTYTVTVTVTDTGGLSSTATASVSVTAGGPVNLVGNPGFETGLSGWNTSGSGPSVTLTQVTGGHSGSFAALLTNTGTSNSGCTLNDAPNWVSTSQAGTYTASIWVRADSAGKPLILRLREYAGSTLVGTGTATVTLGTAWQQVTLTYTPASPGASTLDLNAYLTTANSPPGTCFYADDVSLTLG